MALEITNAFEIKSDGIVDRIHQILKQRNMSQRDFARLLGKSDAEVSKLLSRKHNVTLKTIIKIEEVLGEEIIVIPNL